MACALPWRHETSVLPLPTVTARTLRRLSCACVDYTHRPDNGGKLRIGKACRGHSHRGCNLSRHASVWPLRLLSGGLSDGALVTWIVVSVHSSYFVTRRPCPHAHETYPNTRMILLSLQCGRVTWGNMACPHLFSHRPTVLSRLPGAPRTAGAAGRVDLRKQRWSPSTPSRPMRHMAMSVRAKDPSLKETKRVLKRRGDDH